MATVGLSFGSATSGQGFDVASTVTAILAEQSVVEAPWKKQLTALQAQDAVLSTLGTNLGTLTTSLQSLTDFSGVFSGKQGSSSDTNLLALTSASTNAIAGSHTVTVESLAQTASSYSDTLSSANDTLSGSLTIQVGSAAPQTVSIGSNSDSLATLSAAINAAGIGVFASVISDANGSRLSLVSGTGGTAGQLTVTSALADSTTASAIGFSTGQTGQNASLIVDGVSIASASNTVTTAIPGVSFQLLAADKGTQVQVQVTNDTLTVSGAVQGFVNAYNAIAKEITTQEGNDANGNADPLKGSATLSLLQSQLSSSLIGGGGSGSIRSIADLGLTLNVDGTLTLNTNKLNTALNSDYAGVTGFFQDTGGFGSRLANALGNLGTQAPSGAIYLSQQQNAAEERSLTADVNVEEATLATEKTTLTAELTSANQILQAIPTQLTEINVIYSATTGYNTYRG